MEEMWSNITRSNFRSFDYLIGDDECVGCLVMVFWPDRSFAVLGLSWGVMPDADRLYEDIDQWGDPLLPLIVVVVDEDQLPMVQT